MIQRPRIDTKVQEISAQLRMMAYELGPNAKLPTARQLYNILGTNASTLNDALKELETQHVISRRQGSGIFVSSKLHRKSFCLLLFSRLFVAEAASPFWSMMWAHFAQEMERRNALKQEYYSLHLVLDPPGGELLSPSETIFLPEDVCTQAINGNIHGVLTVGMQARAYEWLTAHHIPSVSFAGIGTYALEIDFKATILMAVTTLIEQGCRAIGIWEPSALSYEDSQTSSPLFWQELLAPYQVFWREEYIRSAPGLFSDPEERIRDYYQQGYHLAREVFSQLGAPIPDGLYIANDLMTSGALAAFQELGVRVGEDIQLVTHANVGSPILAKPNAKRLTFLEVNPALLVQTMFTTLERILDGNAPEEHSIKLPSHKRIIEQISPVPTESV